VRPERGGICGPHFRVKGFEDFAGELLRVEPITALVPAVEDLLNPHGPRPAA
jgi:hypothetical protein